MFTIGASSKNQTLNAGSVIIPPSICISIRQVSTQLHKYSSKAWHSLPSAFGKRNNENM